MLAYKPRSTGPHAAAGANFASALLKATMFVATMRVMLVRSPVRSSKIELAFQPAASRSTPHRMRLRGCRFQVQPRSPTPSPSAHAPAFGNAYHVPTSREPDGGP